MSLIFFYFWTNWSVYYGLKNNNKTLKLDPSLLLSHPSWFRRVGEDCTHKCPCSGQGQKVQKVMVQPINLIFRYLQNRSRIQVWLYEQVNMRIEGCIIGFDEYMNLVLDDAAEIHSKTKSRKQLGRITLKGDNITLLQSVSN